MSENILDDILSDIRGTDVDNPYSVPFQKKQVQSFKQNTDQVSDVKYNVHTDAIYDQLNDGTYIPKFDNYAGAIGNEDRLAKEQGAAEKIWNGLSKNTIKVGTYALDATVGTVYGIGNAINEGSWEGLYDNDFSNTLDDWNKKLDNKIPNYYSDEEKSKGVLSSMLTTNFWANDVAGGLAFVGGALLPELALAVLSGGATAPASFAKIGVKLGAKKLLKTGAKKGIKEIAEAGVKKGIKDVADFGIKESTKQAGLNLMRTQRFAKIGEYTGEVLKTAGFLVRTSNFEAGMEARSNLHDSTDEYLRTFEELNGRQPTFDEYSNFLNQAVTASNWVYGSNLAILSVSNAAMFGAKFGIGVKAGKKLTNFGNRAIGLGINKTVGKEAVLAGANKVQRFVGNTYKTLGKASVEGIYEEGLQGVVGTTMQNYLKAKYDPDIEQGYGLWSSLTDAFGQQYGTKEGWKEMAIGMIIGFGAGAIQGQGFEGIGKNSRKNQERKLQKELDVANKGQTILKNFDRANSMTQFRKLSESQALNNEPTELSNTVINTDFIKTQEHLKTSGEIVKEFNHIVDNMELSQEQIEDLGGIERAEEYKNTLKNEFNRDAENYKVAKSLVKSVGLNTSLKDTPGNLAEIGEALTMNFMVGKSSLIRAKNIATQIDALVGTDGIFNHLEHYNNLSKAKKLNVETLKKKKVQLRNAQIKAREYAQRSEGVELENKRKLKANTVKNNFNKFSEKVVIAQRTITELENEISTIEEAIDLEFRADNMNIGGTISTDITSQSTSDMLGELDKLEKYTESLRKVGKDKEASIIEGLVTEFKTYSDAHRQMDSDFRRMVDTNFFSKKEGKGLKNMILGRKYTMSEDFRKLLRDNDEIIDKSLRKSGLKGYKDVEEAIKNTIEDNEELSDREKYRRESIIRTILGAERLRQRLEDIQENTEIVSSEAQPSNNPLVGDTIALKKKINSEGKDLSNLDVLNGVIDDIIEGIDEIRGIQKDTEHIKALEEELVKMKEQEVEPELEEGDHKKVLATVGKDSEYFSDEESELVKTYKNFLVHEKAIEKAEARLKELKGKSKFKIATTEEYQKLKDLSKKKRDGVATAEELLELKQVSAEIDDWVIITGTVVEGLRLSDLIKQKLTLEEVEILKVEEVEDTSSQEILDQIDISDRVGGVNYSFGQTFEGVTAITTEDGIEISGLNPETFVELTGVTDFKTNNKGNVIITKEVQQQINEGGVLSILPTNKDLTTNYSVVLITRPTLDGGTETTSLTSTFNEDFNGEMNADAIYDLETGQELKLEVNPNDAYNKELLDEYKSKVGVAQTTTVSEEDIQDAIEDDTVYNDIEFDIEDLEAQEAKATTLKKPGITRKKLKKKEALKKRAEYIRNKLIKAANKNKTKPSKKGLDEILAELRRALVIRVKDTNGNFVAVLKAQSEGAKKSPDALKFEALRDQVVANDDFLLRLIETGVSEELNDVGTFSVKKVLTGHPNFNFVKNEDGSVAIESREVSEEDIKHISDVGYVENGVITTKSGIKGLNTTFISKSIRNSGSAKVPFIVLKKGGTKIAYPVKSIPRPKEDIQEFKDIYNSNLGLSDKAIALNKYMARRGIDVKLPGNAFIGIHKHNIKDEFFNEKLAQLESIDYFQDLKSWSDPKTTISQNVLGQILVDVNLKNPMHSPKVQLDLSGITAIPAPVKDTVANKKKNKKSTMHTGSGISSFLQKCK